MVFFHRAAHQAHQAHQAHTFAPFVTSHRQRLRYRLCGFFDIEAVHQQRFDITALHSITRSARNMNACGSVTPIALAVFMFTTSSNLVGCSIGISPEIAPLRVLST